LSTGGDGGGGGEGRGGEKIILSVDAGRIGSAFACFGPLFIKMLFLT